MSTPPPPPELVEDVAVLYVDELGPYPGLVKEWWGKERDARKYPGPWPIVAHPSCRNWGLLSHLASDESELDCAPTALAQVRRFGGVLEHPKGSALWTAFGLPLPGELPDSYGGRTIEVNQCDYGHPARKATWLYLVGVNTVGPKAPRRRPTHWCSGVHTPGARGETPRGIKVCSAQQRRRTPLLFAQWLISLARTARRT